MAWITAFHVIAMVCWMAGLFYLPRLFVYHAMAEDEATKATFRTMERKLYRGITTPSAIATAVYDAVGVWVTELPITPERVLRALDARDAGGGPRREGKHVIFDDEISINTVGSGLSWTPEV